MKQVGSVEVPQEAFLSVLQIGDDGNGRQVVTSAPVRHLYVHLPFCASRCGYCAFVVNVGALGRRDAYLDALLAELERERDAGLIGPLDTVYLGGGTPTLMRPRRLRRADGRASGPHLADGRRGEHRGQPRDGRRPRPRGAAPRRASTGSRWACSRSSPTCWRPSTARRPPARRAQLVGCARAAGFEDLSIDLIFGIPGQTPADLEADLAEALAPGPDHISWYELELKPGTPLARGGHAGLRRGRGRRRLPAHRRRAWRRPATAGTRRPTSPGPGTSAATASPTGARPTTWASASAR